jgi:predicted ribosomally synthesized peptide with nif11-like leader
MKEELKLFLQKVISDEDLQKKMQDCKSPEEAYAVASSVQEGFTFEEFTETMTKVYELANQEDIELTDEDLAKAAGGDTLQMSITISVSVSLTAAAIPAFL